MFQPPKTLDEFNKFLLFTGLAAALAGMFFPYGTVIRYALTAVTALAVLCAAFRLFSANRQRRAQENLRYLTVQTAVVTFFRRLGAWFRTLFSKKERAASGQPKPPREKTHRAHKARKNPTWSEIRQYKYFICPQCAQRLRVPRGKGRLRVTCTRCGNVFETKS